MNDRKREHVCEHTTCLTPLSLSAHTRHESILQESKESGKQEIISYTFCLTFPPLNYFIRLRSFGSHYV